MSASIPFARAVLAVTVALAHVCAMDAACAQQLAAQSVVGPAAAAPVSGKPRQASLDDYRAHLESLSVLVQACADTRDAKTCNPAAVGQDDEVPAAESANGQPPASAPRRLVRYGWLRVLLSQAQEKDASPAKPAATQTEQAWENARPIPPTTTQLLEAAQKRLAADRAQAAAAPQPWIDHTPQRAVMKQVLAQREFADLEETSARESAFEKVGNWLNRALESVMRASARASWLGRALVWGFIVVVCVGLVFGLLQLERRWRVRLVPDDRGPAPGAASAIPWQVWLEDARRAAAAGLWREAIHFTYWAAISRLESKRLWPADRARTPREYLALVAGDDPRRPGLASLTASFERVWYGGRPAGEGDYQRAEQLADALIQSRQTSGGSASSEAESGARP